MTNIEINLTPTATLLEIEALNKIPCRSWGIASESNAAFLLIHGLGGHSGWFEALGRRLKVKHIFGLALDLNGFGKRKSNNGLKSEIWLKDIEIAFKYLSSVMGNKPIFLLGNSMGGLLALKACQRVKPSGLVLLSPAFGGHPKIFPFSYQFRQLFKTMADPNRQVELPYCTDLITRQEQLINWLDNDDDRRRTVPGKVLIDLLFLTQSLRMQNVKLDCPLLLVTAGKDGIVDNKATDFIYKQIKSTNKKKIVMPNSSHDLTMDSAIDQVTNLLAEWSNATETVDKNTTNLSAKQRA
jgi:alpha-beta hydrolase superfamily lysophospholipase